MAQKKYRPERHQTAELEFQRAMKFRDGVFRAGLDPLIHPNTGVVSGQEAIGRGAGPSPRPAFAFSMCGTRQRRETCGRQHQNEKPP